MCGRYRLSRRKQVVEEYFDCPSDEPNWSPRYNIAPTQTISVIRQNPPESESRTPVQTPLLRIRFGSQNIDPSIIALCGDSTAKNARDHAEFAQIQDRLFS
jgi:putative SOS response-associated peptidase YedK